MNALIKDNIEHIVSLCENYKVRRLYAFGSVTKANFSEKLSDIDLFVEMMPMSDMERGEILIDLWDQLESLFRRPVDLITDQPLCNPYFKSELERTRKLIYDREKQEIFI